MALDGWMDGWMDRSVDGWMDGRTGLKIAYSNQNIISFDSSLFDII